MTCLTFTDATNQTLPQPKRNVIIDNPAIPISSDGIKSVIPTASNTDISLIHNLNCHYNMEYRIQLQG